MPLGEAIAGNIHRYDKDFYKITLESSGRLSLSLDVISSSDLNGPQLSLYDCDPSEGANAITSCEAIASVNGNALTADLAAGDYYVRISSARGDMEWWEYTSYELTALLTESSGSSAAQNASGIEYEPNDVSSSAQTLTSGSVMNGNIASTSDIDWYAIELTSAGTLTARLDVDSYESPGWDVAIKDSSDNLLGSFNCRLSDCQNNGASVTVGASAAGTYYVYVQSASSYSSFDGNGSYALTVIID